MNRGLSAGPPAPSDTPSAPADGPLTLPSDQHIRDTCRLAFHDGTCPEGEECRSRELHSQASVYYVQWSSIADAMIEMLGRQP